MANGSDPHITRMAAQIPPAVEARRLSELTSFGGTDLSTKHPDNHARRSNYLPIAPSPPHPDNGIILKLKQNARLQKNSYISTETQHTINFSALRAYTSRDRDQAHENHQGGRQPAAKDYILTSKSFKKLTQYAKFPPPPTSTGAHTEQTDRQARARDRITLQQLEVEAEAVRAAAARTRDSDPRQYHPGSLYALEDALGRDRARVLAVREAQRAYCYCAGCGRWRAAAGVHSLMVAPGCDYRRRESGYQTMAAGRGDDGHGDGSGDSGFVVGAKTVLTGLVSLVTVGYLGGKWLGRKLFG
ncbi:hypothetical protein B0H67DRAFT_552377 [Lasiosphaeris hirsuta]|uniref:Uncharacterized protein n=1 Tax=Lasiosphaeris hirsuta TaxID=260670 RepID=A0AA40AQI2_9PEZI|nr:hypothetical protein B0H67DRAFT_552377 [Lasiosphaeris hirsuta]